MRELNINDTLLNTYNQKKEASEIEVPESIINAYNNKKGNDIPFSQAESDKGLSESISFADEELANIDRLAVTDYEKEWLKKAKFQIGQPGPDGKPFTPEEYEESKKVLTGEHEGYGEGISKTSTYYWDEKGLPKPLKYGEKPPVNTQIQGIWGSQQEADDDTGITTFAKSVWNGFIGIVAAPEELIGVATGLVTGEDSELAQFSNNTADRFKFAISKDAQKEMVNEKAFTGISEFINGENWDPSVQNITGMIGQGIGSLAQFLVGGATVKGVKTGVKAAVKGTKYADEAAKSIDETASWLAKNQEAITSASIISLHEALNAADQAGITGREKYAFGITTSIGMGMLEMIGGADVALLQKMGIGVKKKISKELAKEFVENGGVVTAQTLKETFEQTLKKGSPFIGTIAKQGAGEAVEEISQTYFTALSADTYRLLDGTADFKSDFTSAKTMKEAFQGGLVGFALGAGMTSVNKQAREEAQLDNAYSYIKAGKKSELIQSFDNLRASKQINDIEYKQAFDKINEVEEYIGKFKEDQLTDIEEKRAVDVLSKADNIEAKIEQIKADTTIDKTIQGEKIKALETERKSYVNDLQAVYSGDYLKQEIKKAEKEQKKVTEKQEEQKIEAIQQVAKNDTIEQKIEPDIQKKDTDVQKIETAEEKTEALEIKEVEEELPGKVKNKYKGKIIYATPGIGKSTLVKNDPDQFIDGDELLLKQLKNEVIPGTQEPAFPKASIKTIQQDLRSIWDTLGPETADAIYDRAFQEAQSLKETGKTILFGSRRLIPRVDSVITSRDEDKLTAKFGKENYQTRITEEEKYLSKRTDKPTEIKDQYIESELLNPKDISGAGQKDTNVGGEQKVSAPEAKVKAIVPNKQRFSSKEASEEIDKEQGKYADKLRKLADKVAKGNKDVDEFFKGISSVMIVPKPIITGALRATELALRGGASFVDAIESAIEWISKNYDKWNDGTDEEREEFKNKLQEGIYNAISTTNEPREAVASNPLMSEEEKAILTTNMLSMAIEEVNKITFGDGDAKINKYASKIRDLYENIPGFKDTYEIEKTLMKIGKEYADYSKDITGFTETLINNDDKKIQNIGKAFKQLSSGEIVSVMTFFKSMTPQPYIHIEHTKNNQYIIHQSNNSFEQDLKETAFNKLDKLTNEEYNKKRIAHAKQPQGFQSDVDYLVALTGIEEKHWKNFPNSPALKADFESKNKSGNKFAKDQATYNKSLLKNFVINGNFGDIPLLDTKEKFLYNLTRASGRGKGSIVNTIYLGTPTVQKLEYLKKGFKNTEWKYKNSYAMKSAMTYSASIISNPEVQSNEVWKDNEYVQFHKDSKEGAPLLYINGMYSTETNNKKAVGNLSDNDVRIILIENYKAIEGNEDSYFQPIGQMSDSDMIPMTKVKRYKDIKAATDKYKQILEKEGWSKAAIDNRMKQMRSETSNYNSFMNGTKFPGGTQTEKAGLFLINYAINNHYVNQYYNGLTEDYGKSYNEKSDPLRKVWQRELEKDIAKRNGSTKSPGMVLDTNIPNGIGKSHKLVIIKTSPEKITVPELGEIGEVSVGDGGSFVSRDFSDKIKISSGSRFNFNTLIKAITAPVMPNGRKLLDKTHSITIDELASKLPDSQFKQIAKFMRENGIDKITTQDGAKKTAGYPVFDLFGGEKFDAAKYTIEVPNESLLVQQDLSNDGRFYEDKTPIQVLKNEMVSEYADQIAELYSTVAETKINEYIEDVLNKDNDGIREYILKDLGFSENVDKEELTEEDEVQEYNNQEHIFKLLKSGVPLMHPELSSYVIKYISNLFTTHALGRRSNKGIFVSAPNYNLDIRGVRVEKGKVFLPEVAVSELSGLRGPKSFKTKNEALLEAMKYEDMTDVSGKLLEHEIEKIGDQWMVPGEYVKVSRVPADAPHSTFVGRVKHLLPKVSRNIIISPKSMMHVAGEDFDGDARQVESYFKNNTGYRSDANKAFKMSIEWYYDEKNIKEHLTPIDKEKLKPLLNKLEQSLDIYTGSPESYLKLRDLYQVGLKVVGSMATMQSVGDFSKKHNITLKREFEFPIIKIDDKGNAKAKGAKKYKQFDRNPDSKANYANVQNLAVDNGKELAIELLGLNEVTVNAYSTLLMLNGGDVESAAGFFTHPMVKAYVQKVRNNQSVQVEQKSKNEIMKEIAEFERQGSTKPKGEWYYSSIPLDLADDFSVLHKLKELDAISFDLGVIQKAIKSNDKSPNSYPDYYSQKNGIISTLNYSFEEANEISQINELDVTNFKNSPYFQPGITQINAISKMFNRFSFQDTPMGKLILEHFEMAKGKHSKRMRLNANEIALLSRAIDDIKNISSRNITDDLSKLTNRLSAAIKDGKSPIWDALEVVTKNGNTFIQLKEDLKRAELSADEIKVIADDIDGLSPELKKDLIDYAAIWYKFGSSPQSGSYTSFFSTNIHKEIAKGLEEEKSLWETPGNVDRMISEITEQNPELLFRTEKQKSPFRKIYEPHVNKSKTIPARTQEFVDKMKNNMGVLISETSDKFEEYNKVYPGYTLTSEFGNDKVTKTVSRKRIISLGKLSKDSAMDLSVRTGYDINVFLDAIKTKSTKKAVFIEFESQPQLQKKSTGKETMAAFTKKLDILRKAITGVEVKLDDKLNAAGELSANGKTIKINPNYHGQDTLIHEFGHALIDLTGGTSNAFNKAAISQLKTSKLWAKVQAQYSELSQDMMEKELLATAIGIEGVGVFEQRLQQNWFKNWLDVFFGKLKKLLGIEKNVAKQLARELLAGRKIATAGSKSNSGSQKQKNEVAILKEQIIKAANKIDFDEKSHTYRVGDKKLESVTQGIKSLPDYSYTGPETDDFERNSEMGKQIHKLSEGIANGTGYSKLKDAQTFTENDEVFDTIYIYLSSLYNDLKGNGEILSEVKLASLPNSRAGATDIVHIKKNSSIDIYDVKTSIKSTENAEYMREYAGKKSKHDKHGIQLATYANMLEIGDETTGLLQHEIDLLHVIPIQIKLGKTKDGKDTVTEATVEKMQSFGYAKYKKEARRILTEQPGMETQSEINDDFELLSGKEITFESYMEARQFDLNQQNNRLSELSEEKATEQIGANRKDVLKDIQNQIDHINTQKKQIEKDYQGYKRDRKILSSLYKSQKEDLDLKNLSFKELLALREQILKYDQVATMKFFEIVKNNIGWKMANMRIEEIKELHPDYNPKLHANEDLSDMNVMMKALSDFTEAFPEFQFLNKIYKEHINQRNIEHEAQVRKSTELAKEVIREYNKQHGISENTAQYLDPFANNAKYFQYLEDPSNKGMFRQVGDPKLSKAQNDLLEHILADKNQQWIKDIMLRGSDQQWNDQQIIRQDPKVSETYKKKGIFAAWAQYLKQGQHIGSVRITFKDPKTGVSRPMKYEDIETQLSIYANDGILTKVHMGALLKKYNNKAVTQLHKGLNEDGTQLEVNLRGDFNISSDGRLISKFNLNNDPKRAYSKDFFGAYMNFMQDMIFIKNMEPLLPYIEGVDQYNKFAGKNTKGEEKKKNLIKYMDIWKRGKVLRENIIGPGGKKVDDALKFFRIWTYLNVMAFNIPANVFNLLIGKFNDFVFGSGLGALSLKGERLMIANKKKALNVVNKYHASGFELDLNPNMSIGKFFTGLLFGGGKLTEQWVRNTSFLGYMNKEDYKLHDDEGNFTGTPEQQKEMDKKAIEYKSKIANIQGKYNEEESRNFGHFEMGRSLGQFKIWLPDAWNTRFSGKYINSDGKVVIGTARTLFKEGFRDAYKDVLKTEFYTSNDVKYVQARKNFVDVMSVSLLLSLAASGSDDKEDKFLSDSMWRLFGEASSMYNLNTYEYLLTSPMPGMHTATSLIKTMEQAFDTYGAKGYYGNKGDFKIVHNSFKLLPYHKIIEIPVNVFGE